MTSIKPFCRIIGRPAQVLALSQCASLLALLSVAGSLSCGWRASEHYPAPTQGPLKTVNGLSDRMHFIRAIQRSSGRNPVSFPILASAAGPTLLTVVEAEREVRPTRPLKLPMRSDLLFRHQPDRSGAAYTRLALVARQALTQRTAPSTARARLRRFRSCPPEPGARWP